MVSSRSRARWARAPHSCSSASSRSRSSLAHTHVTVSSSVVATSTFPASRSRTTASPRTTSSSARLRSYPSLRSRRRPRTGTTPFQIEPHSPPMVPVTRLAAVAPPAARTTTSAARSICSISATRRSCVRGWISCEKNSTDYVRQLRRIPRTFVPTSVPCSARITMSSPFPMARALWSTHFSTRRLLFW